MCGYSLRVEDDCCDYGDYSSSERESGILCVYIAARLGSGLHNPHSSHCLGSKIPFLNWNVADVHYAPTHCLPFASGIIFEHRGEGVKRSIC